MRAPNLSDRKLVAVWSWTDRLIRGPKVKNYRGEWEASPASAPLNGAEGTFRGYAVASSERMGPAGPNPLLRGPIRDSLELAAIDFGNVDLDFTITGYACG